MRYSQIILKVQWNAWLDECEAMSLRTGMSPAVHLSLARGQTQCSLGNKLVAILSGECNVSLEKVHC